ncbi:hypothetical protein I4F81_012666 [Pyropia yezoensis]|uniref:Uncharacterized protein n=1 Tax=Pyropia yezoensis TaxID=2788 RepID=A0ACC3CK13_PYRYE|nr:hypothetical protein I4F81_012666 [Neopyropia yezoensis]
MHRRRLLPQLAITVVQQVALNALKAGWSRSLGAKDCHVASCGYEAVMTWHGWETTQVAREACGWQGFKRENRIGVSRAAQDISAAFDSDNTVAADEVARVHTQLLLLDAFKAATGAGGTAPASLGPLLGALGTLHVLAVVDASGGVLLRGDALSPADAAAAHDAVDELCASLRPRAAELVGVMAVPDFLLAPIALDVVAHNSRARP